jgi:hypothetical protein
MSAPIVVQASYGFKLSPSSDRKSTITKRWFELVGAVSSGQPPVLRYAKEDEGDIKGGITLAEW